MNHGGYTFFDTLTYRPKDMPRFRGIPCFNRDHVQYFIKRLRKRIASDYGITQRAFRYFYVSEYGHLHKKPHYHILLFVNNDINYRDLKRYIQEEWKHGFTDLNSVKFPFRGVVQTRFCCEYVAKYVSKPDDYVQQHYEELKDIVSKEEFRRYFNPFHQQSTGFGESLLFDPKNLENFKELFCVHNRQKYTLPMYYVRRIFYKLVENDDGSKSWRENELGLQFIPHYKYQLYEQYTEDTCAFVESIPQLLRVPNVLRNVSEFLYKNVEVDRYGLVPGSDTVESLCRFFGRYNRDFVCRFAYWKRFEQGYVIYDDSFNPLTNFVANEKVTSYFDCTSLDAKSILVSLDSTTDPEYLLFDSLLNVIRSSIGDNDKYLSNLTDKTKKLFTYFNYGN